LEKEASRSLTQGMGGWTAAAAPARLYEDEAGPTGDREAEEEDLRAVTAAATPIDSES
jgi:hypothetical protein